MLSNTFKEPLKTFTMRTDMQLERILIKANYQLVPVNFDDIIFIKAMADYVIVKTTTGKHITLCTMKEVEEALPADRFARSHRSYIVNLDKVSFVRGSNIEIIDRDFRFSIPIGRAYKKDFRQSLQAA
jgi:DNA-binding LytR/AlgR family response regulator